MSERPEDQVPYQATPAATLRQQIMDSRIPKNEREWWASHHIEELEHQLAEARRSCVSGFYEDIVPEFSQGYPTNEVQELVTAEEVAGYVKTITELRAEIERLRHDIDAQLMRMTDVTDENERLRKDAARWKWWRTNRHVTLVTAFFGNGCINRNVEEAEAIIDAVLEAK